MAVILSHPNVNAEPVRQQRRAGRYPKTIIRLDQVRRARLYKAQSAAAASVVEAAPRDTVRDAWAFMQTARRIMSVARARLSAAQQREMEGRP